jgi:Fe-S-cluster containining protein
MTRREFKTIRKRYGIPKDSKVIPTEKILNVVYKQNNLVMIIREDGYCGYLINGRCSIYDNRPSVCRKYGEVPELPCQYLSRRGENV